MNTFFTADLHFGHGNIFNFCPKRKTLGHNIDCHDREIIRRWNSRIRPIDRVYLLGDVTFHRDLAINKELISSLNGQILLVPGNHDSLLLKEPELRSLFAEILPELSYYRIGQTGIILSHYPVLEWENSFHGTYMLHGHSHGHHPISFWRRADVGIDTHPHMLPWSLEEIHSLLKDKPKQDKRLFEGSI